MPPSFTDTVPSDAIFLYHKLDDSDVRRAEFVALDNLHSVSDKLFHVITTNDLMLEKFKSQILYWSRKLLVTYDGNDVIEEFMRLCMVLAFTIAMGVLRRFEEMRAEPLSVADEGHRCAVCLNQMRGEFGTLACGHVIHDACWMRWCCSKKWSCPPTCVLCRGVHTRSPEKNV